VIGNTRALVLPGSSDPAGTARSGVRMHRCQSKPVPGVWLFGLAIGVCFGGALAGPLGMIFFGLAGYRVSSDQGARSVGR
jgi:hypothetical protein